MLHPATSDELYAAPRDSGMPEVPDEFSMMPHHQVIPGTMLTEISNFIRTSDRVTSRRHHRMPCLPNSLTVLACGPFSPGSSVNATREPIESRAKAPSSTLFL